MGGIGVRVGFWKTPDIWVAACCGIGWDGLDGWALGVETRPGLGVEMGIEGQLMGAGGIGDNAGALGGAAGALADAGGSKRDERGGRGEDGVLRSSNGGTLAGGVDGGGGGIARCVYAA